MAATKTLITAEQLLEMDSDIRMELVRGELVKMAPVSEGLWDLSGLLISWMVPFVRKNKPGKAGPELGFILSRDPDLVRAPDVSFVSRARLGPRTRKGFFEGAPDLAVEIISPSEKAADVLKKVREYLAAGTRLVWLVDPENETVTTYRPTGEARVFSGDNLVTGEDVLPGFSFRCQDLFESE